MSAAELHWLHCRLVGGKLEKAQQGTLRFRLPDLPMMPWVSWGSTPMQKSSTRCARSSRCLTARNRP
jgi:hypothetical protein